MPTEASSAQAGRIGCGGFAAPSCRHCCCPLGKLGLRLEPWQLRAQAEHRPLHARAFPVADVPRHTQFPCAQAVESEVQLRTPLAVGRLKLEHRCPQEERVIHCTFLHRRQVRDDDVLVLAICSILANEPGKVAEVVVFLIVLGDELADKGPWRLGVQAVHPPLLELRLYPTQWRPRCVVYQARVFHHSQHILKPKSARTLHHVINRRPHGEGPRHCKVHPPGRNSSEVLGSQNTIQGRDRRLHSAKSTSALAERVMFEEVGLIQEDQG
mmetsp:Transcript_78523/g.188348  ORF Transcript_78523/g.188348 Transcript_78523/m.188348 type:complete len:269 (-) Transcript_78523:689-1495(-)